MNPCAPSLLLLARIVASAVDSLVLRHSLAGSLTRSLTRSLTGTRAQLDAHLENCHFEAMHDYIASTEEEIAELKFAVRVRAADRSQTPTNDASGSLYGC